MHNSNVKIALLPTSNLILLSSEERNRNYACKKIGKQSFYFRNLVLQYSLLYTLHIICILLKIAHIKKNNNL